MNNKKQMSIRRALKNPRTRRRIGGTMETLPGEFADPGAARIEALRRIVANHQYEKIDGQMVDGFTASAIVQVYDALNETNRAKYRAMTVPKMASVAWKFVKNPAHRERVIARAGVSNKSYLSRPSQLSRTTPTKRLRSRRSVNLSAGREGFFPNPPRKYPSLRGRYGKAIRSEFKLMRGQTGGVVGEDARRSLDYARARAEFNRRDDVEIKYFPEEESYESVYGEKPPEGAEFVTVAINIKGKPAASLGFVEANDRNYLRLVENELLAEAFADEKTSRPSRRSAPLRNPTRKSRSLISLTGQHSGKVYGFAKESDLRLDNTGVMRRAALALANKHHEPIRFERVSVTTLSPRMLKNPAPRADKIAAASRRFTRFTGHRAANVRHLPFPDNPGAALAVGPVLVLGYSATRDGKTENYLHKFTRYAAPLVAASHDGNSLYLLGGKYKFTERGIVDLKPR